jgi:hypothetical protein
VHIRLHFVPSDQANSMECPGNFYGRLISVAGIVKSGRERRERKSGKEREQKIRMREEKRRM